MTPIESVTAERIFFAGYKGGFYIRSEEEGGMELRLGGAFQTDYRYYLEDERADNRFDVRRARLLFRGTLTRWFRYGMQFEFQGSETNNLVDAYGEAVFGPHSLRMGQFKVPFSLQWQTVDKGLLFAERSMGYSFSPQRDLGLMLHGQLGAGVVNYALGGFNGDGDDGTTRGNENDDPEFAGRLVISPFRTTSIEWLRQAQLGASYALANIDLANVDVTVQSTGMFGTSRRLYVLQSNTKFGVLQDVNQRINWGVEGAWAWGPAALSGEYMALRLTDLEPVGHDRTDADFNAWYLTAAFCLTGEPLVLSDGVMKPIYPQHFFNPDEGTWGALCLAARLERFNGDPDWIAPDAFVSVQRADAWSVAANWILFPMVRIIADFTHTSFTDPLRVRTQPDGSVDKVNKEDVFTTRFSIDF